MIPAGSGVVLEAPGVSYGACADIAIGEARGRDTPSPCAVSWTDSLSTVISSRKAWLSAFNSLTAVANSSMRFLDRSSFAADAPNKAWACFTASS